MTAEEHNDKPKDDLEKIKEEMAKMRKEMEEMKENRNDDEPRRPRRPRPPRGPRGPGTVFHVEFDDDDLNFEGFNSEDIGDTLNDYLGSVMEGVSENLRRSMEDMARSFRQIEFNTTEKFRSKAEREMQRQQRHLEKAARRAEKAARRAGKRRGLHLDPLSPQELEEFLENAPTILSALTDKRRLQILKILEEGAAYQGELSEKTGIAGGTFKHHMDTLLSAKFVHQEATRGRYLITQLGIEGLKLAELLFRRNKYESRKMEEEEDEIEVKVDIEDHDHDEDHDEDDDHDDDLDEEYEVEDLGDNDDEN